MKKIIFISLVILARLAFAHGEDRPGPNQGLIRMPGAFHVEAVLRDNGVELFLLDMDFKNPTVQNSSVSVRVENLKGKAEPLKCETRSQSYFCKWAKRPKGRLIVRAERLKSPASKDAIYELTQSQSAESHEHH